MLSWLDVDEEAADGAHGYSKKLEKELEAQRAKNAALQRELEAARHHADKQVRCVGWWVMDDG